MKVEKGANLNSKDDEISHLLMEIGLKRNVSKVLVFLSNAREATSRDIERGTDLRQPEVSIAMRQLKENKWIHTKESKTESKGRPVKIYSLAKPITDIIGIIERKKRQELDNQLGLIRKIREQMSG
jgi:predicted transcriptional regulator